MTKENNIVILQNSKCRDCGWPIIDMCCNDQIPPYDEWDWWQYCSNKSCKNHFGEGVFQNTPDFIEQSEYCPEDYQAGYQLLNTPFKFLKKTEETINNGMVEIDWLDGNKKMVASMLSKCPKCDNVVEWTTSGLSPGNVRCKKCDTSFLV